MIYGVFHQVEVVQPSKYEEIETNLCSLVETDRIDKTEKKNVFLKVKWLEFIASLI